MSRQKQILDSIFDKLSRLPDIKVYEQVTFDKWNLYAFDYVGIYSTVDERQTEALEDNSAVARQGKLDVYLLVGNSVKKSPTLGKALLRNAMQDTCELVEYALTNLEIPDYSNDYGDTVFSPLHYIATDNIAYIDDETKGVSLMTFRAYYYK
jgi:hypothetical protein